MPLRWKKHLPNEGRKWRSPQSSQHAPRYLPKGGRRFTPYRPPSLLMLLLIGALKQGLKIKTLCYLAGGKPCLRLLVLRALTNFQSPQLKLALPSKKIIIKACAVTTTL